MSIFKKIILFLISINVCFADEISNCSPVPVQTQDKNIILPGIKEPKTIKGYFLKNISEYSIWIEHPGAKHSASAGWSSYLHPGKWSAILVNRKNFELRCAVIQPGKVKYLDCSKAISICAPKEVKTKSSRKGTYWLVEDKSWSDLLNQVEKRGIRL